MSGAYQAERARAAAYYADAIAGIERRLATAPEDQKAVLEQRLRSTGRRRRGGWPRSPTSMRPATRSGRWWPESRT